eukprot:g16901.t1
MEQLEEERPRRARPATATGVFRRQVRPTRPLGQRWRRKTTKRETSPVAERARVLVIGAGISGLAAAREVLQLPNVDVLEARKRLGGRVHTDRFSDGTVIDLGAQWLHGVCPEHPIARLAKDTRQSPAHFSLVV